MAARAVADGAAVVIGGRRKDVGERAATELRESGGRALFVASDVTVEADVARLVETAVREFGRLAAFVAFLLGRRVRLHHRCRPGDRRRCYRPVIAPAGPARPDGGKLWSNGPAAAPGGCAATPDEKE